MGLAGQVKVLPGQVETGQSLADAGAVGRRQRLLVHVLSAEAGLQEGRPAAQLLQTDAVAIFNRIGHRNARFGQPAPQFGEEGHLLMAELLKQGEHVTAVLTLLFQGQEVVGVFDPAFDALEVDAGSQIIVGQQLCQLSRLYFCIDCHGDCLPAKNDPFGDQQLRFFNPDELLRAR